MRTYLILKEKAALWNSHPQIRALLEEVAEHNQPQMGPADFGIAKAKALLARDFDRVALSAKGLRYEELDQLTTDILLGAE
jgi:xylose isomerase